MKTPLSAITATTEFDSPAWLMVGLFTTIPGWMAFKDGWICFADAEGDVIFNAELDDISNLKCRTRLKWGHFRGQRGPGFPQP